MTLRKSFPVFDCDAHINDPIEIWSEYVEPEYRDLVMDTYWKDNKQSLLNGRTRVPGAANYEFADWSYNPASISGPGMQDKRVLRRLQQMRTTPEQKDYLDHKGAYESHARLRDMDLMGIDQVVIIPSMILNNLPYAENAEGASVLVRAYNNWAVDYCKAAPERLFPAGLLPPQNPANAVEEIRRLAELDFRLALIRPTDAKGNYPNHIFSDTGGGGANMDAVFRAFEETGLVLGIHTFPVPPPEPNSQMDSPSQFMTSATIGRWITPSSTRSTVEIPEPSRPL